MILLTRGDAQHEAKPEQASKLVEALLESTVVDQLINCLGKLDFEVRSAACDSWFSRAWGSVQPHVRLFTGGIGGSFRRAGVPPSRTSNLPCETLALRSG